MKTANYASSRQTGGKPSIAMKNGSRNSGLSGSFAQALTTTNAGTQGERIQHPSKYKTRTVTGRSGRVG